MNTEYFTTLSYQIKYETKNPVPLNEIIDALTSLQTLLQGTSAVLSELSQVEVLGHQIFVTKIETGSLLEDIAVKCMFRNQENLDKFCEWVHETGMKGIVIGAILGGALTFGYSVLTKNNSAPQPTNNISNSQNSNIINIHGDALDEKTKEALNKAIVDSVSDKDKLARQTINFFEPTRSDPSASISFGSTEVKSTIQPEEIVQIPAKYTPKKNNRFEDFSNIKVSLRAADLDNKKSGWAGVIDGETERVKVVLDPTLEASDLYGRTEIVANITLERTFSQKANKMIPKQIIIRAIH